MVYQLAKNDIKVSTSKKGKELVKTLHPLIQDSICGFETVLSNFFWLLRASRRFDEVLQRDV